MLNDRQRLGRGRELTIDHGQGKEIHRSLAYFHQDDLPSHSGYGGTGGEDGSEHQMFAPPDCIIARSR